MVRRRTLCNMIAAIFSLVMVFPIMIMVLDRQLPMVLTNGSMVPPEVDIGTTMLVKWTATKQREFGDGPFQCRGSYVRRFIDSGGFITESKPQQVSAYKLIGETKSSGNFQKEVIVPVMLPGPATYQIVTTYWCNPLQALLLPIVHLENALHFTVRELRPTSGQRR